MLSVLTMNALFQVKHENLVELKKKYKKVSPDEAEPHWNSQFETSKKTCSHAYW